MSGCATYQSAPNHKRGEEAFLRSLTVPEEDRHLFTAAPWRGEFRWFRSKNVVDLERWRRIKARSATTP
jgi:hypothetical protein